MNKIDLKHKAIEVLDYKHGQSVKNLFVENGVDVRDYKFHNTKREGAINRYYYVDKNYKVEVGTLNYILDKAMEIIELPEIKNSEDFDFSIDPNNLPFLSNELENDYTETAMFFDEVIEESIKQITETLLVKGKEYRRNGNPFHNFEEGARKENKTREEVLHGFALKHEISIGDIRNDLSKGILPKAEQVNEKFNDLIIYLLIEKASILERLKTNENAN